MGGKMLNMLNMINMLMLDMLFNFVFVFVHFTGNAKCASVDAHPCLCHLAQGPLPILCKYEDLLPMLFKHGDLLPITNMTGT